MAAACPQGTPEAGKFVITGFKSPATHSSTITGYNDSIRYDYNQDGQYTNDMDINEDGIVNMKDWEIGGLLFTDSYLGGVNWADSGFCYMMYKTLADNAGEGGLWNHVVHVVKVKENYEPKLSIKLNLQHNCREKIKIIAGVSENPETGYPSHTIGFPIFDFQGGCQHMQGGWDPDALALELGLDITPLLGKIRSNQESAFYLMVYENDPNHTGTGKIIQFSIVDHMHNDQEYNYPLDNVPLTENGLTTIGVTATLEFNELNITNESLPTAHTNEFYEQQMMASGGTQPYRWNLIQNYAESIEISTFPVIEENNLVLPDTIHSQVLQHIGFSFPFYGQDYDSIWVHTDGFIMFDEQVYPWPYLYDEHLMIKKTKNISPFLNNYLYIDSLQGNGIWYEGNNESAAFRWKMTTKYPANEQIEFALILSAEGEINFFYNTNEIPLDNSWAAGISKGDGINYQLSGYSGNKSGLENSVTILHPQVYPYELSFTTNGVLSGIPFQNYAGIDLVFDVTDANRLSRRKTLKFHSYVAGIDNSPAQSSTPIKVWPNPTFRNIHVEFHLKQQNNVEILLCDQLGKPLKTINKANFAAGTNTLDLDLINLTSGDSGVFYMVFKTRDKIFNVQKVIVIR